MLTGFEKGKKEIRNSSADVVVACAHLTHLIKKKERSNTVKSNFVIDYSKKVSELQCP